MKILLEGKTINSIPMGIVGYDIDKGLVYFGLGRWKEEIYLESREATVNFMAELIMAVKDRTEEIDMRHHKVYFENIHVPQSKESYKNNDAKKRGQ